VPVAWLTRERLITWGVTVTLALLTAGWIMLPAKERDLQDLKGDVQRLDGRLGRAADRMEALVGKIERGFEKFGDKLDKIQDGQRANREEIIRLTISAQQEEAQPAPAVRVIERVPKPRKVKARPKPVAPIQKAEKKLPSIFDGFLK
jgi:hypothetical protein